MNITSAFSRIEKFYTDRIKYHIKTYRPLELQKPVNYHDIPSAWKGLDLIINDIIVQSGCGRSKCLEFGVEFGYSTSVFSNYFDKVIGVDIFTGDEHAGYHGDIYEKVCNDLKKYSNIELIKSDYKDFIASDKGDFDLIHVDIIHTYKDTFDCGLWSAQHSTVTLFHDTESFPEVKRAVADIARLTGKTFYNYFKKKRASKGSREEPKGRR